MTNLTVSPIMTPDPNILDLLRMKEAMERANEICSIVIPITIGVILFIGLVGNFMVIYVTFSSQRIIKHPLHSMLVVNLAVADLVYLSVNAPYYIVNNILPKWVFTEAYCPFFHFTSVMAMSAGIFTMCVLALMRFMALIHPFKMEKSVLSTRTGGFVMIFAVWVAGVAMAAPNAAYYRVIVVGNRNTTDPRMQCVWEDEASASFYLVFFLVVTYAIPFVLVTVFYVLIGREILCFMRKKSQRNRLTTDDRNGKPEYTKTTIMVLCLIVVFLVCWFPFHLYSMIMVSKSFRATSYAFTRYILKMTSRCLSYAHACVNPIIYTFAAPGFRRTLYASMTCRSRGLRSSSLNLRTNRHTTLYAKSPKSNKHDQQQQMLPSNLQCDRTLTTKFSVSPLDSRREIDDCKQDPV